MVRLVFNNKNICVKTGLLLLEALSFNCFLGEIANKKENNES